MLLTSGKHLPSAPGWVMQPKWDGVRIVALVEGDNVRVWSRNGTDLTGLAPHAERALRPLPAGTILDGEMIALTAAAEGPPIQDFSAVRNAVFGRRASNFLSFVIWDILRCAENDLRALPWSTRDAALAELLEDVPLHVTRTPHVAPDAAALEGWLSQGWEGAVCKRVRSPYRTGVRSPDWTKHKGHWRILGEVIAHGGAQSAKPQRVLVRHGDGRASWAISWRRPPALGAHVTISYSRRDADGSPRDAHVVAG